MSDPQSTPDVEMQLERLVEEAVLGLPVRQRVLLLARLRSVLADRLVGLVPEWESLSARERILDYLKRHVGQPVHRTELSAVSGISEWARRIRELRVEHGYSICLGDTVRELIEGGEHVEVDGSEQDFTNEYYFLLSSTPDEQAALRWKTANVIRRDDTLGSKARMLAYLKVHCGFAVTGEELRYVANGASEWARRVRELRTEDGWSIQTKDTGRPDLGIGEYVLVSSEQLPPHDRAIPDLVKVEVLARDEYRCVDCSWSRLNWHRDDPRNHLELHHVHMHKDRGSNESQNLVTLCNVCHVERHRNSGRSS